MSRKPDLPFIILLVIVIAGGIYLLKLTKQRSGLRRENERLFEIVEYQDQMISELQNLYFQGILPRKNELGLVDRFCLSWPVSTSDSLDKIVFGKLIGVLSRFPAEKVCICLSGEPTTVLKSLFDSLNYEVKICPVLRVKAFFYVNTVGQTKGYFVLNQFSLGLLDKYLKLLRENYLYP